jgi:hypothetical protein
MCISFLPTLCCLIQFKQTDSHSVTLWLMFLSLVSHEQAYTGDSTMATLAGSHYITMRNESSELTSKSDPKCQKTATKDFLILHDVIVITANKSSNNRNLSVGVPFKHNELVHDLGKYYHWLHVQLNTNVQ